MKKSILTLLLLIPIALFAQKGSYVLRLASVDIDGTSKGSIKIDSIKPSQLVLYNGSYTDSLINVFFTYDSKSISFELTNKAKKSIKVIWNEAAYISYTNISGKVMHAGIKYIDRNNDQPATSIIGGAKISDIATPTDHVSYSSGSYGGWNTSNLFPSPGKKDEKTLIGKQVRLLLPILSEGKQLDYVFTFDIVFNEFKK